MIGNLLLFFRRVCVRALAPCWVWFGLALFWADIREARQATASELFTDTPGERDAAALAAVEACKNRLRWHRDPNPEWLTPLVREIPLLMREISAIYHPGLPPSRSSPQALSHFNQINPARLHGHHRVFCKTRTIGRLVDVSAHTALRNLGEGPQCYPDRHGAKRSTNGTAGLLPFWQVLCASRVHWSGRGVAVSNVAARTLQPAIGRYRGPGAPLSLYSGRIAKNAGGPRSWKAGSGRDSAENDSCEKDDATFMVIITSGGFFAAAASPSHEQIQKLNPLRLKDVLSAAQSGWEEIPRQCGHGVPSVLLRADEKSAAEFSIFPPSWLQRFSGPNCSWRCPWRA